MLLNAETASTRCFSAGEESKDADQKKYTYQKRQSYYIIRYSQDILAGCFSGFMYSSVSDCFE